MQVFGLQPQKFRQQSSGRFPAGRYYRFRDVFPSGVPSICIFRCSQQLPGPSAWADSIMFCSMQLPSSACAPVFGKEHRHGGRGFVVGIGSDVRHRRVQGGQYAEGFCLLYCNDHRQLQFVLGRGIRTCFGHGVRLRGREPFFPIAAYAPPGFNRFEEDVFHGCTICASV